MHQDFSRKLKWIHPILVAENEPLRRPAFNLHPSRCTTSRCYTMRYDSRNDCTLCRIVLHFLTKLPLTRQLRQNVRPLRLVIPVSPALRFLYILAAKSDDICIGFYLVSTNCRQCLSVSTNIFSHLFYL